MKIVIVGAVACGTKTASKIRRLSKDTEIVLIDKTDIISYGACGLPYFLSDEIDRIEKLYSSRKGPRNKEYFENEKNIDRVLLNTEALSIDRNRKILTLKDLKTGGIFEESYDKLVIATGADAIRPPLENIDAHNIFNLKRPEDGVNIKELLKSGKTKKPVIIGGGLIGIEVAEAIRKYDLPVKIIDMAETVLPNLFDKEMTEDIHEEIKNNGVELLLKSKVQKFLKDDQGNVSGILINDDIIETDMVILAIGFKPVTKFAEKAGLNTAKNGGLTVDQYLMTSDPDIYAGGDCVMNKNVISKDLVYTPLGDIANIHGRIIANNIIKGNKTKYDGVSQNAVTKFMGIKMGAVGFNEKTAIEKGFDVISCIIKSHDKAGYYPDKKRLKLKMVADRKSEKILGIQVTGSGNVSKALNTISMGLFFGVKIKHMSNADLAYSPAFSPALDVLIVAANVLENKL